MPYMTGAFPIPDFDSGDQYPHRNPSDRQAEKKPFCWTVQLTTPYKLLLVFLLPPLLLLTLYFDGILCPHSKRMNRSKWGCRTCLKNCPSYKWSFFLYSDVSATQEVPIVQRYFGIILPRQHQVHGRCHAFRWSTGALKEEFSLYQTLAWNTGWDYHYTWLTTFEEIEGSKFIVSWKEILTQQQVWHLKGGGEHRTCYFY
jgi:hypothetical protein